MTPSDHQSPASLEVDATTEANQVDQVKTTESSSDSAAVEGEAPVLNEAMTITAATEPDPDQLNLAMPVEVSAAELAVTEAGDLTSRWSNALPDAAVDAITQANLTTIALYAETEPDHPSSTATTAPIKQTIPEAPEELPLLADQNPEDSAVELIAASPTGINGTSMNAPDSAMPAADPDSLMNPPTPLWPIIPIDDPRTELSVEAFKQAFVANLLQFGKSLQTATLAECYTVLALMVRARLLQSEPEAQLGTATRIVGQIATHFRVAPDLETHLLNLGIAEPIYQGLQELGLRLALLYDQETEPDSEPDLGEWMGGYLDSLATANVPAIGYGINYDFSTPVSTHELTQPDRINESPELLPDHNCWMIKRPEIKFEVKFGGYTEAHMDQQGHYHKRWIAQETIQSMACDKLISGFDTHTVNILRLWTVDSPTNSPIHALLAPPARQNEAVYLKQCFLLVSCAIQDVIRLHLQAEASIDTIAERWSLQLNDMAPVLAITELMHRLVDEYKLDWDQAWAITQRTFACTFYSLLAAPGDHWTLGMLGRLLPRHLEIVYEINRRFLDSVRSHYPNDEERICQVSLIEEVGDQHFRQRYLRTSHLAYVGSHAISGVNSFHTQAIQRILPLFSELYPARFHHQPNGITPRRFLLQSNPRLTNLITEWIGDQWMTNPEQLSQLEPLVNDTEFCGSWWQVKRDNKQSLADQIQQITGISVNLNSLFEVQAMPIAESKRQLLNLLHVITLYARIKTNSSTDTMQRFTHRSVPRTVIFAGNPTPHSPLAESIAQLIQAVADTINGDADLKGRLQVVYLADDRFKLARRLYAAADLSVYIPLAGQEAPSTIPLRFAVNGALTLGTPDSMNLELRQTVGVKNLFLVGMTTAEVTKLRATYAPMQHYSANSELQQVIKLIASGYFSYGDDSGFRRLGNWLLTEDPQLVLAEYPAYIECQERISQVYQDQKNWTWMSILSTAQMGQLSSDRAVADYRADYRASTR